VTDADRVRFERVIAMMSETYKDTFSAPRAELYFQSLRRFEIGGHRGGAPDPDGGGGPESRAQAERLRGDDRKAPMRALRSVSCVEVAARPSDSPNEADSQPDGCATRRGPRPRSSRAREGREAGGPRLSRIAGPSSASLRGAGSGHCSRTHSGATRTWTVHRDPLYPCQALAPPPPPAPRACSHGRPPRPRRGGEE
jgi:hypothetical protein